MTPMHVVFILIAITTLFSAVMAVSTRKIMHAALWLVLALFGVAAIFALLEAGFFTVIQVMVYIGAIAILIIFAVMLTRKAMEDAGPQTNKGWWWALIICGGLLVGQVITFSAWSRFGVSTGPAAFNGMDIAGLGKAFVDPNSFLLPFEVASILLLAALVGGIYVAMERRGGNG